MTATTASGATFLGIPGLGYIYGLPALGYALVYPFAVYLGICLCFKQVQRTGNQFGNRSIPEFIGDRKYRKNKTPFSPKSTSSGLLMTRLTPIQYP